MRLILDACILYPTVLREVLMGVAERGGFAPLWSAEILREWRYAAGRLGPEGDAIAGAEIALLQAKWPDAEVSYPPDMPETLSLPDRHDRHVLAAAIIGKADAICTKNLKDFPTRALARYNLLRREPDEMLLEFAHGDAVDVAAVCKEVQARAVAASGREQPMRALLKRAGLPRLGKLLAE